MFMPAQKLMVEILQTFVTMVTGFQLSRYTNATLELLSYSIPKCSLSADLNKTQFHGPVNKHYALTQDYETSRNFVIPFPNVLSQWKLTSDVEPY